MIDRRLVANFDWLLLALVLALGACGVANLYSAASSFQGGGTPVFLKQTYWFGLGLGVMMAVAVLGPQRLTTIAYPFYILVVMLLVAVLFWGKVIGGSQRWLVLGPGGLAALGAGPPGRGAAVGHLLPAPRPVRALPPDPAPAPPGPGLRARPT